MTKPSASQKPRSNYRPFMVRDLEKAGAAMLEKENETKRIPISQFEKFIPLYNKEMVTTLQANNKDHWKYLWGQFVSEIGLYNDFIVVDYSDNEIVHLPAVFLKAASITGDSNKAIASKYQSAVFLNAGNPNHLDETTDEYVKAIYKSQLTEDNIKRIQQEIEKQKVIAQKADETLHGPRIPVQEETHNTTIPDDDDDKQTFTKVEAKIEWDFD